MSQAQLVGRQRHIRPKYNEAAALSGTYTRYTLHIDRNLFDLTTISYIEL